MIYEINTNDHPRAFLATVGFPLTLRFFAGVEVLLLTLRLELLLATPLTVPLAGRLRGLRLADGGRGAGGGTKVSNSSTASSSEGSGFIPDGSMAIVVPRKLVGVMVNKRASVPAARGENTSE